ncbi:hypothetical protein MKQ70_14100 [Chitinophaga sedimenti]|uniref:hypothetical protein n=1 Tax=Chitinophaga sedimenti TaxID=2033606 RepID=UPI002003D27B|nr:hypothetical protein [Chitinophaga sedimenti]MCK7556089.1 hypothetical protein [Chitinophaga sedimenti]
MRKQIVIAATIASTVLFFAACKKIKAPKQAAPAPQHSSRINLAQKHKAFH